MIDNSANIEPKNQIDFWRLQDLLNTIRPLLEVRKSTDISGDKVELTTSYIQLDADTIEVAKRLVHDLLVITSANIENIAVRKR